MTFTRRHALGLAASASAALLTKQSVFAQSSTDGVTGNYPVKGDPIAIASDLAVVHPIKHASVVLSLNGKIVYVDPVGDKSLYAGLPPADLMLITHHHSDHYKRDLLNDLTNNNSLLVTNSVVESRLPSDLKPRTTSLSNGDSKRIIDMEIEAVPAYNTTQDRKQYHPQGRDNGYIINFGDIRIYIAGDTEGIPQMRTLSDIDIAFIPMNLPFTMDAPAAANAVNAFAPSIVYPYHYGTTNTFEFQDLVEASAQNIDVRLRNWYRIG